MKKGFVGRPQSASQNILWLWLKARRNKALLFLEYRDNYNRVKGSIHQFHCFHLMQFQFYLQKKQFFVHDAFFIANCYLNMMHESDAASRWAGWALVHPEFGSSVNPIPTRGQIISTTLLVAGCPPGFENLTASLHEPRNERNHEYRSSMQSSK